MESTNLLPSLKGLANIEVEIVVIRIFDQRDDIYSLEHIGDNAYKRSASSLNGMLQLTVAVEDRHTRYRAVNKLMDDLEDRRFHLSCLEILVRAELEVLQWLAQQLGFRDIDRNEFQDPILGHHTDYHGTFSLIVNVDQWHPPRPRFEHAPTCLVQRLLGMYGYSLERLDANGSLDILL